MDRPAWPMFDLDSLLLEALGSEKLYRLAAGEFARTAREAESGSVEERPCPCPCGAILGAETRVARGGCRSATKVR